MTTVKDTDIKMDVDVKKRTTRVNIFVVVGVVAFLIAGIVTVLYVWRNPPQTQQEASPLR